MEFCGGLQALSPANPLGGSPSDDLMVRMPVSTWFSVQFHSAEESAVFAAAEILEGYPMWVPSCRRQKLAHA